MGFGVFFELGALHILDIEGIDHLVFILAIASTYGIKDWKKLIIMITAFTVGHSITLALAALQIVSVNEMLVETLIPVTLLITALVNLGKRESSMNRAAVYLLILFFGLIHGLGFSNFFNALMADREQVVTALFAFNLGIEAAQAGIVIVLLMLTSLYDLVFYKGKRARIIFLNGGVFFIALQMIFEALAG